MSARSYVVGLPVIVTVREDGGISVEVDMSEATSEMAEQYDQTDEHPTENEMLLDSSIVDAHPGPWTLNFQPKVSLMKCAARYHCEFETFDRDAMAAHLADVWEKHGDS